MGIDYLAIPIDRAKTKALDRGVKVEFLVADALELGAFPRQFDSIIDCGLFHIFSDDDCVRYYVEGLAHFLRSGGKLFLLCFNDEEPGAQGPRRVTQQELRHAFAEGWQIKSIQASRFEVIPGMKDLFSEGGPKAWFTGVSRL